MRLSQTFVVMLQILFVAAFALVPGTLESVDGSKSQSSVTSIQAALPSLSSAQEANTLANPTLETKVELRGQYGGEHSSEMASHSCAMPGLHNCMPMLSDMIFVASGETGCSFEVGPSVLYSEIFPPQNGHPPKLIS